MLCVFKVIAKTMAEARGFSILPLTGSGSDTDLHPNVRMLYVSARYYTIDNIMCNTKENKSQIGNRFGFFSYKKLALVTLE